MVAAAAPRLRGSGARCAPVGGRRRGEGTQAVSSSPTRSTCRRLGPGGDAAARTVRTRPCSTSSSPAASPFEGANRGDHAIRARTFVPVACSLHAAASERTLVLCKPDAVERGLVGEIVGRIERKGLTIVALELRTLDEATAEAALRRARRQAVLRRPRRVHHPVARWSRWWSRARTRGRSCAR